MLDKETTLPTLHSEANRGKSVAEQAAERKKKKRGPQGGCRAASSGQSCGFPTVKAAGKAGGASTAQGLSRDEQTERVHKQADFLLLEDQLGAQGT